MESSMQSKIRQLLDTEQRKLLCKPSEYSKFYEKRIRKLSAMSSRAPGVNSKIDNAIGVTNHANEIGNTVLEKMAEIKDLYNESTEKKLTRLFSEISDDFDDNTAKIMEQAQWYVREGISGRWSDREEYGDKTMLDTLREAFPDEDEFRLRLIGGAADGYLDMYHIRFRGKDVLPALYALIWLFAGLLYVGIFDSVGGSLMRKQRIEKIQKWITEIALDLIPGYSVSKKILDGLQLLFDLEDHNEEIQSASQLEFYFTKYDEIISEWTTLTEALLEEAETITKAA